MGFIGDAIGAVTDVFTGGGNKGPVGYTSPYASEYEGSARQGIYGRLGAKRKLKKGKTGEGGESDYEYDMTGATDPLSVSEAKKPYAGFGMMEDAMGRMGKKSEFTEEYNSGYNPTAYKKTQFAFQPAMSRAYNEAAAAGGKDITRAGQGSLAKLQETVGTRRPGLLLKSGEQANRDVGEQLALLQTSLRGQQAKDKSQMSKEQQIAQAGENLGAAQFGEGQEQFKAGEGYKGYTSRADREKARAAESLARDQGFGDLAARYLGNEQTATESERAYKDKALEYLMDLFKSSAGMSSESARAGQASADARRGQTMGMLGEMSKGSLFCLPKGTHIETDDGTRNVEDFDVGDKVKGGTVIATSRRLRQNDHKFFMHIFENGTVVMSKGHPYFDKLLNMVEVENTSPATYDILTDSGYYFVDGIKLGSTIKV